MHFIFVTKTITGVSFFIYICEKQILENGK